MSSDDARGSQQGQMFSSRAVRLTLSAGALIGGSFLAWGDPARWRSAPSLHWVHDYLHVPFMVWGLLFIAHGLLLLPEHTRPTGYLLGFVLFAVFGLGLAATIWTAGPKNSVWLAGAVDLGAFHAYALRTAWAQVWTSRHRRSQHPGSGRARGRP